MVDPILLELKKYARYLYKEFGKEVPKWMR